MDGVDDIFKSFVSDKLKQLGIKGVANAEAKLEESLRKSALGVNDSATNKPVSEKTNDSSPKSKKPKKDKKKKHKKDKKKRKEKENKSSDSEGKGKSWIPRKHKISDDKPIINKKSLIIEDEEEVIKSKTLNCYHETESTIKEIEKLPLNVEPEDDQPERGADFVESDVANKSSDSKEVKVAEPHCAEPSPLDCSNLDCASAKLTKSQSSSAASLKTDELLISTLKEMKSMSEETVAQISKEEDSKKAIEKKGELSSSGSARSFDRDSGRRRKHSSRRRSRSRSRSKSRKHRKRSRSPSKSRHKHHHRHQRHRSRSKERHHRHRHHHHKHYRKRSRSSSPIISHQDKVRLLAIAKANALAQHRADSAITSLSNETKAAFRSGGFTVAQLTGVCKDIVEGKREVSSVRVGPEEESSKINHPFQVKQGTPISFKINPSPIPTPPKPISQLTKEFPVSSGSHHQTKEEVYGKWEPVSEGPAAQADAQQEPDKVFPTHGEESNNEVPIQKVIADRIQAVRKLEENPNCAEAKLSVAQSQSKLDTWMNQQQIPGRFTGSTSLQPLTRNELEKGHAAWASNQTFNSSKQVGGIGKSLLQKMGWKDGESLGKTNVGLLEPLKVNVKTDRKGLSSFMEKPAPTPSQPKKATVKDLCGKHPVSALMELCTKRKWQPPDFRLVGDTGPDHNRTFLFKVVVNNVEYQPSLAAPNKKLAKSHAATAALQAMGLVPK